MLGITEFARIAGRRPPKGTNLCPCHLQAQVTVRSPAKINLGLSVGPPRPDGFHPLATVYQAVALYDDVTATLRDDDGVTVEVVGDFAADVPADDSNLAVRAARLLQAEYDVEEGVDLVIRKTIPVAGGMAGGSTDAAATLVACNRLWGLSLSQAELEHSARSSAATYRSAWSGIRRWGAAGASRSPR